MKVSEEYKERYLNGIDQLIFRRQEDAAQKRKEYAKNIFTDPERYRADLREMLGWPLVGCDKASFPSVTRTLLSKEDGYTIYRMSIEIFPGVTMTGLYYEMDGKKAPLVLVQHGSLGTPEKISGFYNGDTTNYNHMLERVISHGTHAFAPQLLLWNKEVFGVVYDRYNIDARLRRLGGSIAALELYGLGRVLDYFEAQDNVSSFGMVGLSYGGFYTLFFTALETRIKSAISCAFFNTRDAYPWNDWTWLGSAEKFDDAEVACLVYPRRLCLELGNNDALFDVAGGLRSYERLIGMCGDVGTDWVSLITFDGGHEFCPFDEPIERLIKDL